MGIRADQPSLGTRAELPVTLPLQHRRVTSATPTPRGQSTKFLKKDLQTRAIVGSAHRSAPGPAANRTRTFMEINLAMLFFIKKKGGGSCKKSLGDCSRTHTTAEFAGCVDATRTGFGEKETHRHLPREMLLALTPQGTDQFLKGKNHQRNAHQWIKPILNRAGLPKCFGYLLSKSHQPLHLP